MASAPSATHLRLMNFAGAFLLQLKNSHEVRWFLHNKHAKCGPDFIPRWKSTGGSLRKAHWDKWASWVTMYPWRWRWSQPSSDVSPMGSEQWARALLPPHPLPTHHYHCHHHQASQSQSICLFRKTPGIDWMDMIQSRTFPATLCWAMRPKSWMLDSSVLIFASYSKRQFLWVLSQSAIQ